jgi:hypothetical protein
MGPSGHQAAKSRFCQIKLAGLRSTAELALSRSREKGQDLKTLIVGSRIGAYDIVECSEKRVVIKK